MYLLKRALPPVVMHQGAELIVCAEVPQRELEDIAQGHAY